MNAVLSKNEQKTEVLRNGQAETICNSSKDDLMLSGNISNRQIVNLKIIEDLTSMPWPSQIRISTRFTTHDFDKDEITLENLVALKEKAIYQYDYITKIINAYLEFREPALRRAECESKFIAFRFSSQSNEQFAIAIRNLTEQSYRINYLEDYGNLIPKAELDAIQEISDPRGIAILKKLASLDKDTQLDIISENGLIKAALTWHSILKLGIDLNW